MSEEITIEITEDCVSADVCDPTIEVITDDGLEFSVVEETISAPVSEETIEAVTDETLEFTLTEVLVVTGGTAGDTVVEEKTHGLESTGGSSEEYSRSDHSHGTPDSSGVWGGIAGTLSDQTDLQSALDAKNSYPSPDATKVGFISVTQAVDLDAMESDIDALSNAIVLKGLWDATIGTFPGVGVAQAGWSYIVEVSGTVDGVDFVTNDRLVALTNNASTSTYAGNWHKLDYTDTVLSVAGRTGAVVITAADLADFDTEVENNTEVTANTTARHTQGTDTALGTLGTKTTPIDADKVIYRNSEDSDNLVTSTWSQVKSFLKSHFDTLYLSLTGGTMTGDVDLSGNSITDVGTLDTEELYVLGPDEVVNGDLSSGVASPFSGYLATLSVVNSELVVTTTTTGTLAQAQQNISTLVQGALYHISFDVISMSVDWSYVNCSVGGGSPLVVYNEGSYSGYVTCGSDKALRVAGVLNVGAVGKSFTVDNIIVREVKFHSHSTSTDFKTPTTGLEASNINYRDNEPVKNFLDDSIGRGVLDAITVTADAGIGNAGLNISWTTGEVRCGAGVIHQTASASAQACDNNATNHLYWDTSAATLVLSSGEPASDDVNIAHIECAGGVIWEVHTEPILFNTLTTLQHGAEEMFPLLIPNNGGCLVVPDTDATSTLDILTTGGEYYHDLHMEHIVPALASRLNEMYSWYKTAGSEDFAVMQDVDTTQYNDGTNLATLPVNKWVKAKVLVSRTLLHFIYPEAYYNNEATALDAVLPDTPPGLTAFPESVAIVYQKGETDISNATFLDIRPRVGGGGSSGTIDSHLAEPHSLAHSGLDLSAANHVATLVNEDTTPSAGQKLFGFEADLTTPVVVDVDKFSTPSDAEEIAVAMAVALG